MHCGDNLRHRFELTRREELTGRWMEHHGYNGASRSCNQSKATLAIICHAANVAMEPRGVNACVRQIL